MKDHLPHQKTLDSLVRFPELTLIRPKDKELRINKMNEVAILNCAQSEKEDYYRPEIVGVYCNSKKPTPEFDNGNAERNQHWRDAATRFAQEKKLPLLTWEGPYGVDDVGPSPIVSEWFNGDTEDLGEYLYNRERFLLRTQQELTQEFRKMIDSEWDPEEWVPMTDKRMATMQENARKFIAEDPKWEPIAELIFNGNPYRQKNKTFLLSDEQLETYGLRRR